MSKVSATNILLELFCGHRKTSVAREYPTDAVAGCRLTAKGFNGADLIIMMRNLPLDRKGLEQDRP